MKRKLLILITAVLAVACCFTACTFIRPEETKTINSIQVVEGSVPTEVNIGTTPDFSGIKVTVIYADESTEEIGFNDVTISEVDTTTVGNKSVTVKYREFTTKFTVAVVDPEASAVVTSIKILIAEKDMKCYVGEQFDMSVLQVEATYSTGRQGKLEADKYDISAVDTSAAGTKTITATYKDDTTITASVDVEVIGIDALNVVSGTVEKRVTVGTKHEIKDIEVVPHYADGFSGDVLTVADLEIVPVDTSSVGEKKLLITYKGFTAEYTVTVVEKSALAVDSDSYPKVVDVYGNLASQLSGIKAHYTDPLTEEAEKDLPFSVLTIDTSAVNMTVPGDKEITVSYKGATTTIIIHVRGVESMSVITPDGNPSELVKGDALSTVTNGLKLSVVYTTGAPAIINVSANMLGTFDVNTKGAQGLSITYLDKTIPHNIYVKEVVGISVDEDTIGEVGEECFDLSEMVVYAVCDNGTMFELTDGEIKPDYTGVDWAAEGEKKFKVTYDGKYGEWETNVTVDFNLVLEELIIKEANSKTSIGYGQLYTKGDVEVWAKYESAEEPKLLKSGYTIDINTHTLDSTATLTVTYAKNSEPMTATLDVTINQVKTFSLGGVADEVDVGNKIDLSSAYIIVEFMDGSEAEVVVGMDITTPDTSAANNDGKITVTYGGVTKEFKCVVRDIAKIEIVEGSIPSTVNKGYTIDYLNLLVKVTYTNGSSTVKAASDIADISFEGTGIADGATMDFVVKYKGVEQARKTVTVVDTFVEVDHISALNKTIPSVVYWEEGGVLSYQNFKLYVYCKNGEVLLIPVTDGRITVTPAVFDLSIKGERAIKFEYYDGVNDAVPDDEKNPLTWGIQPFETIVNVWVKKVESIEIVESSVLKVVTQGKEIDTSDISIKVTYDDESYNYIDRSDTNLVITKPDTSNAGTVTLKVSFRGKEATMDITVKAPVTISGEIFGALLPDDLVRRTSYMKNFKDSSSVYRVGDDNPYYFYLNIIALDADDNLVEIDGSKVATTAKIYLVEGGTETLLEGSDLDSMVTFVSSENSYDFTQEAVGKTFKLEIYPEGYEDDEDLSNSHTVKVVDGWNIYNAWELNIITNMDVTIDDAGKFNQKALATKFLSERGVTRPENLAGVVLHCNLDVTVDDIPADYLYEYTKNGVTQKGFYDQFSVYNLGLTNQQKTFDIYGNYYSIYSYNLPCVVPKGVANNPDDYSSSQLFKMKAMSNDTFVNGQAFNNLKANVWDLATRDNDPNSNDQTASERHMRGLICYKVGENETTLTNVNVEAYMTSLCVEDANSTLNLRKVNFYNAWQGHLLLWNDNVYQRIHLGKQNESTLDIIQDLIVNIEESDLTKCGGPVILAQNASTDLPCNNKNAPVVNVDDKSDLHTYVTGQEAWFVATGQTARAANIVLMGGWIDSATGGHNIMAGGKIDGVKTMNIVMVTMGTGTDIDGSTTFNGLYKENGVTGLKTAGPNNNRAEFINSDVVGLTAQTFGMAPILQTSSGGLGYIFTSPTAPEGYACYFAESITFPIPGIGNIPVTTPEGNEAKFTQAQNNKYITIYQEGIGIMMEYYH